MGTAYAADDMKAYVQARYRYEYDDNFSIKYYGDNPKTGERNDGFRKKRNACPSLYLFYINSATINASPLIYPPSEGLPWHTPSLRQAI